MDANKDKREYYLDWIRVIIVLLLVPFHTAVSFSHIGKGYIYSDQPVDSLFFTFLSDYLNLWFMRMLFFISGISAFMALKKRTGQTFLVERLKRLLIPVIFMILFIGPLSGYILAINHYDFSGSLLSFYPHFFMEIKRYLFWGHMWFCIYLLIFSLSALPVFLWIKRRTSNFLNINLFLPMFLIIALETLLRPYFPGYQSFWGDWANVVVHFSFFILGFLLWQDSNIIDRINNQKIPFLFIAMLSTILHIYIKRYFHLEDEILKARLYSACWGSGAYSWVMFYLAIFSQYCNKRNRALTLLSKSSFSLYLFHYLILSFLNSILLRTTMNHYLIWGLTSLFTYILFFFLFNLILTKSRVLRFVGAIKI